MTRPLRLAAALLAALALLPATLAPAAARGGLIRDAEIEATLARVAAPVFQAAGIGRGTVDIYIVDDPGMNAFVAGGRNIFLNTGLLTRLESIDALRWVIAHETGHITGGHLQRRDQALRGARGTAVIGMLGAAAATIAGSPEAGIAIATTSGQVAGRSALAHSRTEEATADQAGLRYFAAAGGDPQAVLEVFRLFRGQEMLRTSGMDPYAQTHPLWRERIAMVEERVAALPPARAPDAADVYWHARMVAKLEGFLGSPRRVLAARPASGSEADLLARAVALHRLPDVAGALDAVEALIAARPDDPFYHELAGQFLLESGRAAPAVDAYRRAVALDPEAPLVLGGLGRALLNTGDAGAVPEARDTLARSAALDRANPGVLHDLALAEARLGNDGAAALATAERFVLEGAFAEAERNAARAAALLSEGSPGWQRAQDVITQTRRALK